MIRALHQKSTSPSNGDCFATCVAMILGLEQDSVPNFCHQEDDWWGFFQKWLDDNYQLTAVEIDFKRQELMHVTPGLPLILTGQSPRGDWLHSVVGMVNPKGFEYLHDPHPAGLFLKGKPQLILFFVPLRPDRVIKHE